MEEYRYSWKPSSEPSIDEFLQKMMARNRGSGYGALNMSHLTVNSTDSKDNDSNKSAIENAHKLLEDYTEKIASIQKDASIPVRANKKKGLKSKKEVREEVAAEATEKFKQISQASKLTLFFVQAEQIDGAFSRMARDLVTGALSKTPAFCLKVATTPADVLPNHRYLICLYLPDLYDKAIVTEVLRTVCQSTGIRPNSAKTDLYTILGLDSKHASGIKSTIWNPTDLVPDAELKALTDAYWSEATKKTTGGSESASKPTEGNKKKFTKRPRKEPDDDVFDDVKENNSDDDATTTQDILDIKKKSTGPPPKAPLNKIRTPEDSATESESDEAPTKAVTAAAASKPAMSKPTKPIDDSSSDEEVGKPKKIRRF